MDKDFRFTPDAVSRFASATLTPPNKSMNSDPLTLGFVWLRQSSPSLNGPVISDVRRRLKIVPGVSASCSAQRRSKSDKLGL